MPRVISKFDYFKPEGRLTLERFLLLLRLINESGVQRQN
jgi:hypothetical protein